MRSAVGILDIRADCFWTWIRKYYDLTDELVYKNPIWDSQSQQLILYPQLQKDQNEDNNVYIDGVELWTWIHNKYFGDGMERIFDEDNIIYPEDNEIIMELNYAESDCCDPLSWSDKSEIKPDWLSSGACKREKDEIRARAVVILLRQVTVS